MGFPLESVDAALLGGRVKVAPRAAGGARLSLERASSAGAIKFKHKAVSYGELCLWASGCVGFRSIRN
eukprot:6932418-Prymnesium_polylepis.1